MTTLRAPRSHADRGRSGNIYADDPNSQSERWRSALIVGAMVVFCIFYGMAFALIAPYLLMMFAMPLAILAALVIWALPDARRAPTGPLQFVLYAFLVALAMWPNYLGFSLPDLPWFTPQRIATNILAFLLALCYSTSSAFRKRVKEIFTATPVIWRLIVAFIVLEALSVFISTDKSLSISHLINAQTYWTSTFIVSAYMFSKPGHASRFSRLIWGMAVVTILIGFWEYKLKHVPWQGHIPRFLQIQDPRAVGYMALTVRAGSNAYRMKGTFLGPLNLGEYLAMILPFVIQFALTGKKLGLKILAVISVALIVIAAILTGSRSSLIGCAVGIGLSILLWAVMRWRSQPGDILAPAVILSYPVVSLAFFASTFVVGRLRNKFWGGGDTAASTQARVEQWSSGVPLVLQRPWGHGIGTAASVLNYREPSGLVTIDSYYLSMALEYGFIGVVIFFGIFLYASYRALKVGVFDVPPTDADAERQMLIPAGISLISFVIVKSIFSQEANHPIAFMILGLIVALLYRNRLAFGEQRSAAPSRSANRVGGRRRPGFAARQADRPAA